MYHSIKFGEKDAYEDWHLVATSRPVFNPPVVKTKYLDIPGASGSIDLTESLTSFPLYSDAEGEFEFYVLNGFEDWNTLYTDILAYLHGQKMKAWLEDDSGFYHEGRFSVNKWKSEAYRSKIVIKYKVNPFRWKNEKSTDEWIWDTFNFETDYILTVLFRDIEVNSDEWIEKTFIKAMYGSAPVCPKFIVENGPIYLHFVNKTLDTDEQYTLQNGETTIDDIMLAGDECSLYFKGHGSVSVEFNPGRL